MPIKKDENQKSFQAVDILTIRVAAMSNSNSDEVGLGVSSSKIDLSGFEWKEAELLNSLLIRIKEFVEIEVKLFTEGDYQK